MYGSDIIEVVKSNPYKLANDIWIIEFRTADSIAKKLGFEKNCFPRCRSGILYTLNQLADKGHVYAEKEQLIAKSTEFLNTKSEAVSNSLEKILDTSDLILDTEHMYMNTMNLIFSNGYTEDEQMQK